MPGRALSGGRRQSFAHAEVAGRARLAIPRRCPVRHIVVLARNARELELARRALRAVVPNWAKPRHHTRLRTVASRRANITGCLAYLRLVQRGFTRVRVMVCPVAIMSRGAQVLRVALPARAEVTRRAEHRRRHCACVGAQHAGAARVTSRHIAITHGVTGGARGARCGQRATSEAVAAFRAHIAGDKDHVGGPPGRRRVVYKRRVVGCRRSLAPGRRVTVIARCAGIGGRGQPMPRTVHASRARDRPGRSHGAVRPRCA